MLREIDPDVRSMLQDDDRLQQMLKSLTSKKRKTAKIEEVWTAFGSVYEDLPSGRERRLWLLTVLEELDGAEEIVLPVEHGKLWDHSSDIPLPTSIRLCVSDIQIADNAWKSFAWHPQLQWILARRHIASRQIEFLKRVHQGLVEGWFDTQEAFKYRSLQLANDEKRLHKFARTQLFGPGKLSLELLGCERETLPLAIERISDHPTLLMFENAAPFMVARDILRESKPSQAEVQIGGVAYGAGKQVIKSVGYLPTLAPKVKLILYVGDLDAEGTQIASDLKRLSSEVEVLPATAFHSAMLRSAAELNARNGWPAAEGQRRELSQLSLSFLDSAVRSTCEQLVHRGHRIPEEVLSHKWMRSLIGDLPARMTNAHTFL